MTNAAPETAENLLERVRALKPLLRENAAESERQRRIADRSFEALLDAGAFSLSVPHRFGGPSLPLRSVMEIVAEIAEADAGAAWAVNLLNEGDWLAGLFPDQAQNDVFGGEDPARVATVLAPSGTATKVDGGWRVSGEWPYSSGSLHATWAIVGVVFQDEAGEVVDQGIVILPRNDFEIRDTWHVAGMRASGSNTVIVTDKFVPDHRRMSTGPAIEGGYPAVERDIAHNSAFVPHLGLVLVGPLLGAARGALQYVIEKSATKGVAYTSVTRQADSVAFQLLVAEAAQLVDTAHLHAFRAADDIDRAAAAGEYPDYLTRARIRADIGTVAQTVLRAFDVLLTAHGAGSFAEVNRLQRLWRDAETAARHAIILPTVGQELYGKALVGAENDLTPLV